MKSKIFGSLVAGAVAGLLTGGVALAKDTKKKGDKKKKRAESGWCKANSCGGTIPGAKNGCAGEMACKTVTKADCEKDGAGTWTTEPKPKKG